MTLKRLAAKMAPKHAHLISLSKQSGLKNEFCRSDNRGPLVVVSKILGYLSGVC